MTTNDAAERLLHERLIEGIGPDQRPEMRRSLLDAALAAERHATVERMVQRFGLPGTAETIEDVHRILDAERDRDGQALRESLGMERDR